MEISKARLSIYSSLSQLKLRRKHGLFIVEGEKAVKDSLERFKPEALLITRDFDLPAIWRSGITVYEVTPEQMKKISNLTTPSSVAAILKIPEFSKDSIQNLETGLFPVLDCIQDPGNLGTIIRTCHWFGIPAIFASKDTVDLYNPKTVQSTMGSLGKVKVIYTDLQRLFEANPAMPVYGTLLDGEDIFKATLEKRGFILFGNEGKGISMPLRKYVTHPLLIPPGGPDHSESLNVAIAAAITISQFIGR